MSFSRLIVRFALPALLLLSVIAAAVTWAGSLPPLHGDALLYMTTPDDGQRVTLYAHDLARDVRIVVRDNLYGWGIMADWSPDGQQIVYSSYHANAAYRSLYLTDLSGNRHRLISGDVDMNSPAWSPDGTTIAYQAFGGTTWNVHLYEVATGRTTQLTDRPGTVGNPSWAPSGERLAMQATHPGQGMNLMTYDLETGDTAFAAATLLDELYPVWLNPETLIYVTSRGVQTFALWQVHLPSDASQRVESYQDYALEPTIAPDGRYVAFLTLENGTQRQIAILNLDTGRSRLLTRDQAGYRAPRFRP